MGLIQPRIHPLQPTPDVSGQTTIVTGASSGIGLEIARQLLVFGISRLVLAVRNPEKGEVVKKSLLSDEAVRAVNPNALVEVMQLDIEKYESVAEFATAFTSRFDALHLLMLNAASLDFERKIAKSGHEKTIQVIYLSNVLLNLKLLPILEATADKTGKPSQVTWTGSRSYRKTSLESELPLKATESVLKHFDEEDTLPLFTRYADSKLLCFLFTRELALRYDSKKVIVNSFCPNTVKTGMASAMPFYVRIPAAIMMSVKGRPVEEAGRVALHAALNAGSDTHGKLLENLSAVPPSEFVESAEGQRIQRLLWSETKEELKKWTSPPAWMLK